MVESLVLLILNETLSGLEGGPRDVNSLSGVAVNEDASVIEDGRVVNGYNIEELAEDIGIELFVS